MNIEELDAGQIEQLIRMVSDRPGLVSRLKRELADKQDRPTEAFVQGGIDTLSAGFADEAVQLADKVINTPEKGWSDQYIAYRDGLQESNPGFFMGGQFGGGAALPTFGARALMSKGAGPFVTGALTGGASAGIYSLGSSDRLPGEETLPFLSRAGQEAAVDSGVGAVAGGVLGPLTHAVGRGISSVTDTVRDLFPGQDVASRRVIQRSLLDDGLDSVDRIRSEQSRLGDEAVLADLGNSVMLEGASHARIAGPGRSYSMGVLEARNEGAMGRVEQEVVEALSPGFDGSAAQFQKMMRDQLKEQAEPLYRSAYEVDLPITDEIEPVLKNPLFQQAIRDAKDAITRGAGLYPTGGDIRWTLDNSVSTRMIHESLQSINDRISVLKRSGDNPGELRDLMALKDRVRSWAFENNEDFAKAQQTWAGERSMERAMEFGQGILGSQRPRAVDVVEEIQNMSKGDSVAFKVGMSDAILGRLETLPNNVGRDAGDASRRVINNQRDETILRATYPDNADSVINRLDAEARFRETRNSVKGGSQTSNLTASANRSVPVTSEGLVSRAVSAVMDRMGSRKIDDAGRERIAKALYTKLSEMSDKEVEGLLNAGLLSRKAGELLNAASTGAGASLGVLAPEYTYR